MLILSRKIGESVRIGDNITITVIDIDRNKIRLGFSGPPEVPIHRSEIYDRIHSEPAHPAPAEES